MKIAKHINQHYEKVQLNMEELTRELQLFSQTLKGKIEEPIYCIDLSDIPTGMTADEFIERWEKYSDRRRVIFISL